MHKVVGKGELWLGALPTEDRMHWFKELNIALQISCFKKAPNAVFLKEGDNSTKGMFIPGAVHHTVEVSNPDNRAADVRRLKSLLATSLYQGDNAYVHCMTGVCRAPVVASVLYALLTQSDPFRAFEKISYIRNIQ